MAQKRLLRETGIVNFVRWLNHEESEASDLTEWGYGVLPFLRSDERMLGTMMLAAIESAVLGERKGLQKDLGRLLDAGVSIPQLMSDLWRVRECACGCNRWFIAARKNHKHFQDHRKQAWQRRTTPATKDRRRVQNREAQKRYYSRTFKAPLSDA